MVREPPLLIPPGAAWRLPLHSNYPALAPLASRNRLSLAGGGSRSQTGPRWWGMGSVARPRAPPARPDSRGQKGPRNSRGPMASGCWVGAGFGLNAGPQPSQPPGMRMLHFKELHSLRVRGALTSTLIVILKPQQSCDTGDAEFFTPI